MKLIALIFISLLLNFSVLANLLNPNFDINPKDVISIQLKALMKNDIPSPDTGIAQTWEFAHPQNRQYTGPLSNFTKMLKSKSYEVMINHISHNIIYVNQEDNIANYFVELTDKNRNKFGFTWTLKKVLAEGKYKDCWMTVGVSQPIPLAKSA